MDTSTKEPQGATRQRRPRIKLSCGECRRRKQKCDQKQPCGHCIRRFPQPVCEYSEAKMAAGSASRSQEAGRMASRQYEELAALINAEDLSQPTSASFIDEASVLAIPLDHYHDLLLRLYINEHSHEVSLLGTRDSNQYQDEFIPYAYEHPVLGRVATYTGACMLNRTRKLDNKVLVSAKGRAIQSLNQTLAQEASSPSDPTIAAVIVLTGAGICHDETEHLRIHVQGIREMIRLRGGISSLGMNGLISKLAIIVDFITSVTLEIPMLLKVDPAYSSPLQPSQLCVYTPLISTHHGFQKYASALGLESKTAAILDDVQFVIDTALSLPPQPTPVELRKLRFLADWVESRILTGGSSFQGSTTKIWQLRDVTAKTLEDHDLHVSVGLPNVKPLSTDSPIHECIKIAALITCRAVRSEQPYSKVRSQQDVTELMGSLQSVPLETWKGLVAVLQWILITVASELEASDQPLHGRSVLMVATLHMALADWAITSHAIHRIKLLQRLLLRGFKDWTPAETPAENHSETPTETPVHNEGE